MFISMNKDTSSQKIHLFILHILLKILQPWFYSIYEAQRNFIAEGDI